MFDAGYGAGILVSWVGRFSPRVVRPRTLAQVPVADEKFPGAQGSKTRSGGARRSGCCHCRVMMRHEAVVALRKIMGVHYLTEGRLHGVARPFHQLHRKGGLVVVLLSLGAAGLMLRVASDRSAKAVGYDHGITVKMTMRHPHGRVESVRPGVMTLMIGQG